MLLIDDEPHILTAIGRELNEFSKAHNISIIPFETGEDCLKYLGHYSDDVFLVLSDLRLPGIQGSDLLVSINKRYPDIMLIMLTAYSDINEIRKAVSATLSSLLLKPWNQDMLLTEVKKAFDVFQIKRKNRKYQKEMSQQLKAAGEFQKRILCIDVPKLFYLDCEYLYQPTAGIHCSGDYFDIIEMENQRTLLLIGDVSGHGVKPAFVTGIIKVLTRSSLVCRSPAEVSAAEIAMNINKKLCDALKNNPDLVITFQVILVNALTNTLRVSNAGHLPSYVIRDNKAIPLLTEGPAMGFRKNIQYTETQFTLKKQDRIVMMTDGILDSPSGKNSIAPKIISDLLIEAAGTGNFLNTFNKRVQALHPENEFSDDVTMLSCMYRGRP